MGNVIGWDRRNMPGHWPGVIRQTITGTNLPLAGWPGEGGHPVPPGATAGNTACLPPNRVAQEQSRSGHAILDGGQYVACPFRRAK